MNGGIRINMSSLTTQVFSQVHGPERPYDVIRGEMMAKPKKNNRNYSGAYYRNAFKVSGGPIILDSIGFYGPALVDVAKYDVTVYVETPTFMLTFPMWYHCCPFLAYFYDPPFTGEVYATFHDQLEGGKEKIFYANFKEPIVIQEDVWMGITFTLKGPSTPYLAKVYDQVVKRTEYGNRTFKFMTGSGQMPILRFRV